MKTEVFPVNWRKLPLWVITKRDQVVDILGTVDKVLDEIPRDGNRIRMTEAHLSIIRNHFDLIRKALGR